MNNTNYSTYDYIDSLKEDKTNMVGHLNSIGVPVGESETFTELVKNIPNLVPKSNLSDLTITPTTSQQEFNHPDSDGYNQVDVKAVTSSIDLNIQPENIKKGISILGVTGTLESGGTSPTEPSNFYKVKSIEERDSLVDVPEGAICLVDESSISNATSDSQFQVATLPQQVVFDEPFTEFVDVRYRAVDESAMLDIRGNLDSNMFMLDGFGDIGGQFIEIRVEYMSEDGGTTYNRLSPEEDTIDFGTPVYYEMPEMWNDAIGKFLLVGSINFTGLFEYKNNSWTYYNIGISSMPKDYLLGTKAYTSNGIIEGKLVDDSLVSTVESCKEAYKKINDLLTNLRKTTSIMHTNKSYSNLLSSYNSEYVDILKIIDMSGIEDISLMLSGNTKLVDLTIDNFDTSSVKDAAGFLAGCPNLKTLSLNIDTSNIEKFWSFLQNCTSLVSADLSSFTGEHVLDLGQFCLNCPSLETIKLPNLTSELCTRTELMFCGCNKLKYIDISSMTFTSNPSSHNMFKDVPDNCEILVKSETEKQWITSRFANLTNVKVKEAI